MRRLLRPVPAILLLVGLVGIWELYVDLGGAGSARAAARHTTFAKAAV